MLISPSYCFSIKVSWWLAYDEAQKENRPTYWIDTKMKCFGVSGYTSIYNVMDTTIMYHYGDKNSSHEIYESDKYLLKREDKWPWRWQLINKETKTVLDTDKYRHDLAERNKIELARLEDKE